MMLPVITSELNFSTWAVVRKSLLFLRFYIYICNHWSFEEGKTESQTHRLLELMGTLEIILLSSQIGLYHQDPQKNLKILFPFPTQELLNQTPWGRSSRMGHLKALQKNFKEARLLSPDSMHLSWFTVEESKSQSRKFIQILSDKAKHWT